MIELRASRLYREEPFRLEAWIIVTIIVAIIVTNEILVGIVLLIVALASRWLWKKYKHISAFKMRFTNLPFNFPLGFPSEEQSYRGFYKKKELSLGESWIYLGIQPRIGVVFDRINLRFVGRKGLKFWQWENAPGRKIFIADIEPYDPMTTPRQEKQLYDPRSFGIGNASDEKSWFVTMLDGVGGCYVEFNPAYERTKGEFLWLTVKVMAFEQWKGHISFQSSVGPEGKASARLPVEVIEPLASDREGPQNQ